MRTFTVLLFNI